MKIEIDLNDIFGDEYGSESLQESVRRQVIENLTKIIKEGIGKQIDYEVASILNSEISAAVKDKMPQIVDDLLHAEYTPVDRWGGSQRTPTTFRKELVKSINEQMVYAKKNYDSEKNAFTKAVDDVIAANVKEFKESFNKKVDAEFTKMAFEYATSKLKEKLGIK